MLTHTSSARIGRGTRAGVAFVLAMAAIVVVAAPASAAAPGNDTAEGAIVAELPLWDEIDTTEATTDETDAILNEQCGAPATDASVWYTFTASEDALVDVAVWESDYSAGVIVAAGLPEEPWVVTCGPGEVLFEAFAGETYHVLAFDDQEDGGGNGGTLVIHIESFIPEPPPEIAVTIDPIGYFTADGDATVSGSFTCVGSAEFVDLFGRLAQQVGRFTVQGYISLFDDQQGENGEDPGSALMCDGTTQAWVASVHSDNGLYKGGHATVELSVFACGFFDCSEQTLIQDIRLRRQPS